MDKKNKVLVVEDDKFLNKLYSDKLTREGFEVIRAISGEEGLRRIVASKPDIILLDIVLPQKNGFDLLKEIKENEITKNIPVVILTFLGQPSDIETGKKLGAIDYLIKTDIPVSRVVEAIKTHVPLEAAAA